MILSQDNNIQCDQNTVDTTLSQFQRKSSKAYHQRYSKNANVQSALEITTLMIGYP